jgi:tRNA threonylcarbamoyladenosine biosynthesis protein TsaB
MITLYIDTSSAAQIIVGVREADKKTMLTEPGSRRSQVVLPLIHKLLTEKGLSLKDITNIEVALGPGSFTGLRVGVSIANTIAQAYHLPINQGKPGEPVFPIYS